MLVSSDYDGTIAQTFVPSPHNIGVEEAYRLSCGDIFGPEGLQTYDLIGGLQNMAPLELVTALLEAGDKLSFLGQARAFLERERLSLEGFVLPGRGSSLDWQSSDPILVVAEILVRTKMRHFWDEIGAQFPDGRIWPEACAGFIEFYRALHEFAKAYSTPEVRIDLGIISSGHDLFIARCFEAWGVSCPDLLVTDDLMRSSHCVHMPMERRSKPEAGPYEMLEGQWKAKYGMGLETKRVLHAGDSVAKDGNLSRKLGIPFVWFNPASQVEPRTIFAGHIMCLRDWRELEPLLRPRTLEMMTSGLSFSRIIIEALAR